MLRLRNKSKKYLPFSEPSEDGDENLGRERLRPEKIFRVGNVMIGSLVRLCLLQQKLSMVGLLRVMSELPRPANIDDSVRLKGILESLLEVNQDLAVVFPAHPQNAQANRRFRIERRVAMFTRP